MAIIEQKLILKHLKPLMQWLHAWFLEIGFVHDVCNMCVYVCVCVSTPEAIIN